MKSSEIFKQTGKDTLINVSGTFLVGLVGLIFYILVARYLGPSQFGLFSVAVSVLVVSADIFDFGTNTGIVKFVSEAIGEGNLEKAKKIAKFAFLFKFFIGLAILFFGFLISDKLAIEIFQVQELSSYLPLSFLGALVILLLGFFTSIFQAYKKFVAAVFINLASNLIRLAAIVILAIFGKITIPTVMIFFSLSPIVGIFLGFLKSPLNFLEGKFNKDLAYGFLSFNKWIALGFILAAVQVRLPNFLLIRLSDPKETGLFSAASSILLFAPQVAGALSITFAPRLSQIRNLSKLKQFFRKTILITLPLSLLSLILIPAAQLILNLTVGREFIAAAFSFQILVLGSFFLILSVPQIAAIIYYWSKPQVYTTLSFIQLVIIFVLNLLLIPSMGAYGASISLLVAAIAGFSLSSLYVFLKWRQK